MEGRSLISLNDLSAKLTALLQASANDAGSTISIQYSLHEPDATGCNWSSSAVLTTGEGTTADQLHRLAEQLIRDAQKKFNVKN